MLPEIIKDTNKKYIIGIDEVGMGPLAGPVYVCAFKAPTNWALNGLRDSKKLTEKKRNLFATQLETLFQEHVVHYNIVTASSEEIDSEGIYNAAHRLYYQAIQKFLCDDSLVVIDGRKFKENRYEFTALVKGDDLVPHISAASVLAKVNRDEYMKQIHALHPEYDWDNNKGYGTANHLRALNQYGITPFHRRSYEPIKSMVK